MRLFKLKRLGGLLFVICFCSCSVKTKRDIDIRQIEEVKYWLNRQVYLPVNGIDTLYCLVNDENRLNKNTEYKVLVYVDSSACTSCNLDLYLWNELVNDASAQIPDKLSFLVYCQPKYLGKQSLLNWAKRDRFNTPILIDSTNQIGCINSFINHFHFQCFLLGKSNEILVIGDPTQSLEMWEHYKNVIKKNV